jgi:hypothetical protein
MRVPFSLTDQELKDVYEMEKEIEDKRRESCGGRDFVARVLSGFRNGPGVASHQTVADWTTEKVITRESVDAEEFRLKMLTLYTSTPPRDDKGVEFKESECAVIKPKWGGLDNE